jgi:hypothetical protein
MTDDIKPGANRLAGIDPTDLLKVSTDELAPLLALQYAPLTERNRDLVESGQTLLNELWNDGTGKVEITSDVDTNRASDIYNQLKDHAGSRSVDRQGKVTYTGGEIRETRDKVVKPLREAIAATDSHFGKLRDDVGNLMESITGAQLAYNEAKRVARNKHLLEVARKAQDEAAAAIEAARKAKPSDAHVALDLALAAEAKADEAAAIAAEPLLTAAMRTQSAMGTTTTEAATWDFEVKSMMDLCKAVVAGAAPVTFLTTVDQAIRLAIRAKQAPLRECPGLEIKQVFGVRRR